MVTKTAEKLTAPQKLGLQRLSLLVKALRSGKFTQGINRLTTVHKDKECDCCLAVACKVAMANGLQLPVKAAEAEHNKKKVACRRYGRQLYYLPGDVKKWFGFRDSEAAFRHANGKLNSLALMNDTGKTFKQIADTIEENARRLLKAFK